MEKQITSDKITCKTAIHILIYAIVLVLLILLITKSSITVSNSNNNARIEDLTIEIKDIN
jgi:hypothetical protein